MRIFLSSLNLMFDNDVEARNKFLNKQITIKKMQFKMGVLKHSKCKSFKCKLRAFFFECMIQNKSEQNHNLDTEKTELIGNSLLHANDAILQIQHKKMHHYILKTLFFAFFFYKYCK